MPAADGGGRRAETALLARRREHRDRTSDASFYWKSAASAMAMASLPLVLARCIAARHALKSPSSGSPRGGTRLAIPALTVT